MNIASKLDDFENNIYLDKISEVTRNLIHTKDTLCFVRQMVSLSSLLRSHDEDLSDIFRAIDEKAQDPTYFIVAYFDTKDVIKALWVYKIVRSLTRYILLLDKYYETGDDIYTLLAKQVHESIIGLVQTEGNNAQLLSHSIDYSLKQFSAFWEYEQLIKTRIPRNYPFSYKELRHFNLSKSSDASIVYARILDALLPSFNENVSLILHYNQALLDIYDDLEDIEEDIRENMPNIFVMAAIENTPYETIKNTGNKDIRKLLLSEAGCPNSLIIRLINEVQSSVRDISIPEKFAFLRSLSNQYANTLRELISQTNPI